MIENLQKHYISHNSCQILKKKRFETSPAEVESAHQKICVLNDVYFNHV